MQDEHTHNIKRDPKIILQTAIEELDVFTQTEASRFEVKDGRLVAAKETRLERVVGLALCYLVPFFSDQVRLEQEEKLVKIKQAILQARDVIQSHSDLIEKLKAGDDSQRKLAAYALLAIQRYNAVVAQNNDSEKPKYKVYNYERHRLLLDQEIKDQPIELPRVVSIKYDSHPNFHPAQKMLQELSQTLLINAVKIQNSTFFSTHKGTIQFMIDTFRTKSIRMMKDSHLSQYHSMSEILELVKQTQVEIDVDASADLINMRQFLEVGPGFFCLVTGSFKRNLNQSKFMTMPILDSFRLNFQLTHSGFPYPSQRAGWSLAHPWVEASPLRRDQVPLFQKLDQRKKRITQKLLFDHSFIQRGRSNAKLKRKVFDQCRDFFLPLHYQLHQALMKNALMEEGKNEILETFYKEIVQSSSPFDTLTQIQQQLLELFVKQPIKALEEEWLGTGSNPLRMGAPHERFQAACERFEYYLNKGKECLDFSNCQHAFILQQGMILGKAFQAIALQYLSEKMGFSPPLLNDFERKLQACAFLQLIAFMGECENQEEELDHDQIKNKLLNALSKDLEFLLVPTVEDTHALPFAIINELEVYFNSRFSSLQSREFLKNAI